jgi:hypothetical protein
LAAFNYIEIPMSRTCSVSIKTKEKLMHKDFNSISLINLLAGHLAQPGAPILHLALMYDSESGTLNGEAMISQAVTPPNGRVLVRHVSGDVRGLGLGGATRVMTVQGEFIQSLPPPAIGSFVEKFTATFVTDNHWKGHGSFEFASHKVTNVPVGPNA